jgi:hypothetical protein
MTVWAISTERTPLLVHLAAGCPASGWIHEGRPPYRVIVADRPDLLPNLSQLGDKRPYSGAEETIQWRDLIAEAGS